MEDTVPETHAVTDRTRHPPSRLVHRGPRGGPPARNCSTSTPETTAPRFPSTEWGVTTRRSTRRSARNGGGQARRVARERERPAQPCGAVAVRFIVHRARFVALPYRPTPPRRPLPDSNPDGPPNITPRVRGRNRPRLRDVLRWDWDSNRIETFLLAHSVRCAGVRLVGVASHGTYAPLAVARGSCSRLAPLAVRDTVALTHFARSRDARWDWDSNPGTP